MITEKIQTIHLPKITDPRGSLSFIESQRHIPFNIKRVYYLYDLDTDSERGGHAHTDLEQFIICLSGSFHLLLDDGKDKTELHLNKPWEGIYVPNMIWREMKNFSSGCILLVLASEFYKEQDYIRSYQELLKFTNTKR